MTWACGVPYVIPKHPCPSGIRCEFPTARSKADCQRPPGCLAGEELFREHLVIRIVAPCVLCGQIKEGERIEYLHIDGSHARYGVVCDDCDAAEKARLVASRRLFRGMMKTLGRQGP